MCYIDCHCHVADNFFYNKIELIIPSWIEGKIKSVGAMATNLQTSKRNLELAQRYPQIIEAAIARHPWGAHKFNEKEKKSFEEIITSPLVKIIGEIGLDYYFVREKEHHEKQIAVFNFFLELAQKNKKPIMIHQTGAETDVFNILTNHNLRSNFCCHWYSGDVKILKQLIDLGAYFSINPALKYSEKHQSVLKYASFDRILTESDGPLKFEGNPGSPLLMPIVCNLINEFTRLPIYEVKNQIEINYQKFITNY